MRIDRLAVDALAIQNNAFALKKKEEKRERSKTCRCEGTRAFGVILRVFFPPHMEDAVDVTERPADGVHVQRPLQQ